MNLGESEEVQQAVERVMRPKGHPLHGRPMPTIESLTMRWRDVAEKLERGYLGGVDDYIHDLDRRDTVQEVLDALPNELRRTVELSIAPIDARFRHLTRDDPTRILERVTSTGEGWWWSRLPRVVNSNLEATLRPFR